MTDAAAAATRGAPVLLVEDDPRLRQTIRWTLEDEGLAVAEAADAQQALAALRGTPPTVVVLDYGLPDMDGGALVDALRARPERRTPPIVLITADGRAPEKAARVGAATYLAKPFEVDELAAAVRRALGVAD